MPFVLLITSKRNLGEMLYHWLVFMVIQFAETSAKKGELLFVHTVWNHGSTSPSKPIPADRKNLAGTWREGLGEITQRGKAEAFKLGTELRDRYIVDKKLLPGPAILSQQVYIRSSDCNRSISTAYATLVGFLPQTKEASQWTTVPVHSRPLEFDELLNSELKCPLADQRLKDRVAESKILKDLDNIEFWNSVVNEDGISGDLKIVYLIWEALRSTKNEGRQWPKWMTQEKFQKIENIVNAGFKITYSDHKIARLKGGSLLSDILKRINDKVECLENEETKKPETCFWLHNLKFYGYSADDMTLQSLLAALGALQGRIPGEAAAVSLELWRNRNKRFEIMVLYRPHTASKLRPILIGGCKHLACPLEIFQKRSKPFIPANWEKECGMIPKEFGDPCESEVDESSEQNCEDWAKFNYCREDAAVRYLFCRKTCLCNPKFAKHKHRRL